MRKSIDDEDIKYTSESQKHRRVGKFFGESLDVSQPSSLQGKIANEQYHNFHTSYLAVAGNNPFV